MTPLERAFREERAQVVATLARRLGDLQLAEDAVSDAFATAAATWPAAGVPDRPGAWLTTTAWRKALDVLRRDRSAPGVAVEATMPPAPEPGLRDEDDLLQLVLTCCHPALAIDARVALTLRHVAGLSVPEIAAGFLVPEETMAKRLVRARTKIRQSRISFELPEPEVLGERLASVQAVLYLVFTEGHLASGDGPAVRIELCDEAIWLTRQVQRLLPDDCETTGLLALMLLQHSRAEARHDGAGRLVPFAEQDRSRWDARAIAEARELLATTGRGRVGQYQIQAAIAALHAAAPTTEEINWPRIADLYGLLDRVAASPVVTVNRAVAVGRADGPRAGIALLLPVLEESRLAAYAPLHAAYADLLERAGDDAGATAAWRRAAELSRNPAEQAALERRAARAPRARPPFRHAKGPHRRK
jgi:RNA polymerase sigma-70 factor (ECF subfamily)